MQSESKVFRLDREALQALVGPGVDPWTDEDVLLGMVKGKEVIVPLKDEKFENFEIRGIIMESQDEAPGAAKLLIDDWQGRVRPKTWAIKLL